MSAFCGKNCTNCRYRLEKKCAGCSKMAIFCDVARCCVSEKKLTDCTGCEHSRLCDKYKNRELMHDTVYPRLLENTRQKQNRLLSNSYFYRIASIDVLLALLFSLIFVFSYMYFAVMLGIILISETVFTGIAAKKNRLYRPVLKVSFIRLLIFAAFSFILFGVKGELFSDNVFAHFSLCATESGKNNPRTIALILIALMIVTVFVANWLKCRAAHSICLTFSAVALAGKWKLLLRVSEIPTILIIVSVIVRVTRPGIPATVFFIIGSILYCAYFVTGAVLRFMTAKACRLG